MKNQVVKTALALCSLFLICFNSRAQEAYGEIRGIIKDINLEVVPFATVKILQGNLLVGGTQSDAEGRYNYKPLLPGTYEMVIMEPGHITQPVNGIEVVPNDATYVDVKLNTNMLGSVTVVAKPINYMPPGVDRNMFSMVSIDYKDLNVNANYVAGNISSAIVAITSDVLQSTDGELHFRGSRGDASSNYVDGVRTFGQTSVPGMAIENLTILTGGVPACYGDVTGGVIIITTKSYFSGIRDKNIRIAENREKSEEVKKIKKAQEEESKRIKEIEAEKEKNGKKN